jgi:hypothetical protein
MHVAICKHQLNFSGCSCTLSRLGRLLLGHGSILHRSRLASCQLVLVVGRNFGQARCNDQIPANLVEVTA